MIFECIINIVMPIIVLASNRDKELRGFDGPAIN